MIAQRIERAHLYSFNLPNYRSTLADDQVASWHEFASKRVTSNELTLEKVYRALCHVKPKGIDSLVSSLNPRHALELDIARQFLEASNGHLADAFPHLNTLKEIIATQTITPFVQLRDLLVPVKRPASLEPDRMYRRVTVKLRGKGVKLRDKVTIDDMKGGKWFVVKDGDLIVSKIDARNGAFGVISPELDDAIVTSEFPTFVINATECDPTLLLTILTHKHFYGLIETKVSGASGRRRLEPEQLLEMQIPMPAEEAREEVVALQKRAANQQRGFSEFLSSWDVDHLIDLDGKTMLLGDVAVIEAKSIKDLRKVADSRYVGGEHIESGTGRLVGNHTVADAGITGPSYPFKAGQVVYSKVRPNLRKCFFADFNGVCSSDIYPYTVTFDELNPEYLAIVMASRWFAKKTSEFHDRAGMPKINRKQLATIRITVPLPDQQQLIIERYHKECAMIASMEQCAAESGEQASRRLDALWEE